MVVDKYRPIRAEAKTEASPVRVIATLWLLFLALSLYGSRDLYAHVAHDDDLPGRALLIPATKALRSTAEATGILAVRDVMDGLQQSLDGAPTILAEVYEVEQPPTPPPPPTATPEPTPETFPKTTFEQAVRSAAGHPARRILLIGASSIQYYLGAEIERRLESYEGVQVKRFGKLSTGLARPDVLDWQKKTAELKKAFKPDVTIALFGGNDCQPMEVPGKGPHKFYSEVWNETYGARVEALVKLMQADGGTGIMLGMPSMRSKRFNRRIEKLNKLIKKHTEAVGGTYIETWDISADEKRRYKKSVTYGGETGLMRLADGIHYSRLGGQFVADRLTQRFERMFTLKPPEPELAQVLRFELPSEARGGEVTHYAAFVPKEVPDTGLPVLYLLHGKWGAWTDWSENAHRDLQRLAVEHRLIIVTPDGRPHAWYVNSPLKSDSQIRTYFFDELVPHVDRSLPTDGRRAIAGLSMGGHGAVLYTVTGKGVFSQASSMSGVLDFTRLHERENVVGLMGPFAENAQRWQAVSALHQILEQPSGVRDIPLLVTIGSKDKWAEVNKRFAAAVEPVMTDFTYEVTPKYGHSWKYWKLVLPRHVAWHAERFYPPGAEADAAADTVAPATGAAAPASPAPSLTPAPSQQ